LAGFLGLGLLGPGFWFEWLAMIRTALTTESVPRVDEVLSFSATVSMQVIQQAAPLLAIVFLAVLATMLAQIGLVFTWQPLSPSLSRINPWTGLQRLFSLRGLMHAAAAFMKLLVVAAVAYLTLVASAVALTQASVLDHFDTVRLTSALAFRLAMQVGVALLILALLDYAWQRYRSERELRMTKEEVKDELRSMEGDPHIRRRRRELQLQLAMQRLRKDVPKADVVVTNPTHVAVALQYDAQTMPAPKVIAKGADYAALRIRQIAKEFSIPIVERPPLARALHQSVDVGQYIPERLYKAIAEVLAYVYELTGRSPRGVQATVP
jgi:flagellar biosynthetic protein FlhB